MTKQNGIGRWQGAGLLATTLLGTGVFILPQLTLQQAGGTAMLAWLLLTVLAIPITVVFASLAGRLPDAAGPAHFVSCAFGPLAGRVVGLLFICVVPLGASAALLMTWSFIEPWFGESWRVTGQLSFLLLLFVLNRQGFHLSARLQLGLTIAIVLVVCVLLLLMIPGAVSTPAKTSTLWPSDATWPGFSAALAIGFWSFVGVEAMTHLAQDFSNPRRDMLPALCMGLVLVGAIYLGCSWLLFRLSPDEHVLSMAQAFDVLCGDYGQLVIGVLGLCSGLATVNVYTASVVRLAWRLSTQGVLPTSFSVLNRHQVAQRPLVIILLLMATVILAASQLSQPLAALISWVNGVFIVIYALTMLAATRLLPAHYRLWAWFSVSLCLLLMLILGQQLWYVALLLLLLIPLLARQQRRQQGVTDAVQM